MYILGLGGSNHDYSACLLEDDTIKALIEDERITRNKHCETLGLQLVKGFSKNYCLAYAGLKEEDIDLVVANDILNPIMYKRIPQKVHLIDHHLAHAASAYYPSGFSHAAIMIVDAVGSKRLVGNEWQYDSITYAYGKGKNMEVIGKVTGRNLSGTDLIENSLGIFYSVITEAIGFGPHQEGKTMGLAPYGTDHLYKTMRTCIRFEEKGRICMTEKDILSLSDMKELVNACGSEEERFAVKADLAWACQEILEEGLIHCIRYLRTVTDSDNLCLAGGIALNSVANYKIYKTGLFRNIFIPPACGDNGTSMGSALYGYHVLSKERGN